MECFIKCSHFSHTLFDDLYIICIILQVVTLLIILLVKCVISLKVSKNDECFIKCCYTFYKTCDTFFRIDCGDMNSGLSQNNGQGLRVCPQAESHFFMTWTSHQCPQAESHNCTRIRKTDPSEQVSL